MSNILQIVKEIGLELHLELPCDHSTTLHFDVWNVRCPLFYKSEKAAYFFILAQATGTLLHEKVF